MKPLSLHFFKSDDGKSIRIVKQVNSDTFVVIKLIQDGPATLKIWKGTSLAKTSSYWSTKAFTPSDTERKELEYSFQHTLGTFSNALDIVSSWATLMKGLPKEKKERKLCRKED